MVRKASEERREEILRSAGAVVLARGFAGISARELAAEIGVSAGLLHHYFSSMDEIRGAAVQLFVEEDLAQLDAALATHTDPVRTLDEVLRFFTPAADDQAWALWMDAWTASRHTPEMQLPVRRLNERSLATIARVVADGVASGAFTSPDPGASALLIGTMMDGLTIQVLVFQTVEPHRGLALLRRTAELELGLAPGTLGSGRARRRPARRVHTTMRGRQVPTRQPPATR
jgi:AcrR family transcriptional regulator